MSLDTWKKEFYPIGAEDVSKKDALQHSHQKWIGLRPDNLAKHDLRRCRSDIMDDDGFELAITSSSCALCEHHAYKGCTTCPLYEANGNMSCDEGPDQYGAFTDAGCPEPMIALIEKAIAEQGASS